MPRFPMKASPWMLAAEAALAARRHWQELDPADQRRLRELVPKARRGPAGLTAAEKAELKAIVGRLDVPRMGKSLLPIVGRRYKHRR